MARNSRRGDKNRCASASVKIELKGSARAAPDPEGHRGDPSWVGLAKRDTGCACCSRASWSQAPGAVPPGGTRHGGDAWTSRCSGAVGQRELAPRGSAPAPGQGWGGRVRLCGCIWQQGESGGVLPRAGNVCWDGRRVPWERWRGQRKGLREGPLEPRSLLWFLESKPELPLPEPSLALCSSFLLWFLSPDGPASGSHPRPSRGHGPPAPATISRPVALGSASGAPTTAPSSGPPLGA